MSEIHLRKASAEDAVKLIELQMAAASGLYAIDTEERLQKYAEDGDVFMILKGEEVIGAILYDMEHDGSIYLSGIVIAAEYQGQGYSKIAMREFLREMDECNIHLTVHPDNASAVKLYLGVGFTVTARKENCFGDGQPRLVMERSARM